MERSHETAGGGEMQPRRNYSLEQAHRESNWQAIIWTVGGACVLVMAAMAGESKDKPKAQDQALSIPDGDQDKKTNVSGDPNLVAYNQGYGDALDCAHRELLKSYPLNHDLIRRAILKCFEKEKELQK